MFAASRRWSGRPLPNDRPHRRLASKTLPRADRTALIASAADELGRPLAHDRQPAPQADAPARYRAPAGRALIDLPRDRRQRRALGDERRPPSRRSTDGTLQSAAHRATSTFWPTRSTRSAPPSANSPRRSRKSPATRKLNTPPLVADTAPATAAKWSNARRVDARDRHGYRLLDQAKMEELAT